MPNTVHNELVILARSLELQAEREGDKGHEFAALGLRKSAEVVRSADHSSTCLLSVMGSVKKSLSEIRGSALARRYFFQADGLRDAIDRVIDITSVRRGHDRTPAI